MKKVASGPNSNNASLPAELRLKDNLFEGLRELLHLYVRLTFTIKLLQGKSSPNGFVFSQKLSGLTKTHFNGMIISTA